MAKKNIIVGIILLMVKGNVQGLMIKMTAASIYRLLEKY